jgi:predicted esterase
VNPARLAILVLLFVGTRPCHSAEPTPTEVRASFLKLLDRPRVPLDPRIDSTDRTRGGQFVEHLSFATEVRTDGAAERVPTLLIRPEDSSRRRPAVIVLHGTGGTKEGSKGLLEGLAKRGFVAVAIDGRYHGERNGGAKGTEAYNRAIIRAWRSKPGQPQEHPFYYDTCWDVWRTIDYLQTRSDVDPERIGLIGFSKGGIETYLAGAVDERVKVAIPAISVQCFNWGLEHDRWQGRAKTIAAAHEAAASDLGESAVNAKVCRTLWDKVIPGMTGPYDGPSILRLFTGRPLLILNGSEDPNCPIEGARLAFTAAATAYREAGASDRLKIDVAQGVGHSVTEAQHKEALAWFERWLKP